VGVLLVLVASGVFAFFRGLVHELLAVVSWIGAAIVTYSSFPYVKPVAHNFKSVPPLIAEIGAGVLIFLAVLVILSVLTRILSRRVRHSSLGALDRSLGLVFGFLRGAVLVCVAWLALIWMLPREDHPDWITEARSLPLVQRGGTILVDLIPPRLRGEALGAPDGNGADRLRETEKSFQSLLNPVRKGDARAGEPGYNERMRDDMQRAIEAATQGIVGAEEPVR
ncbi:MAG: CvpA family protein, partial [Kiloniellaceae bacterium]